MHDNYQHDPAKQALKMGLFAGILGAIAGGLAAMYSDDGTRQKMKQVADTMGEKGGQALRYARKKVAEGAAEVSARVRPEEV